MYYGIDFRTLSCWADKFVPEFRRPLVGFVQTCSPNKIHRVLYVKKDSKVPVNKLECLKFHAQASQDPSGLACDKRVRVDQCEPVGAHAPSLDMVCKACTKRRFDLF